jgi:predicted  nucleic acid-binding Zn-ribbon protein
MLYEGDVLACIQIVDGVSIATSTNFMIHVLINPNDGSSYTESDDYSDFQKAVISLTNVLDRARKQMTDQKIEFEDMQLEFMRVRATADEALAKIESFEALAQEVLEKTNDIDDVKAQMAEIQETQKEIIDINTDKVQAMIDASVEEALAKHDEDLQFFEFGFDDGGD